MQTLCLNPLRALPLQADYGLMVFADMRYQRHDKRDKLPTWITSHLKDAHLNLSTDMLLHVARQFMRSMGQPYPKLDVGKSLLTEAQVRSYARKATCAHPCTPLIAGSTQVWSALRRVRAL